MGVLEMYCSRALSLVCEVALVISHNTLPSYMAYFHKRPAGKHKEIHLIYADKSATFETD
jgi:hypothetical protein